MTFASPEQCLEVVDTVKQLIVVQSGDDRLASIRAEWPDEVHASPLIPRWWRASVGQSITLEPRTVRAHFRTGGLTEYGSDEGNELTVWKVVDSAAKDEAALFAGDASFTRSRRMQHAVDLGHFALDTTEVDALGPLSGGGGMTPEERAGFNSFRATELGCAYLLQVLEATRLMTLLATDPRQ